MPSGLATLLEGFVLLPDELHAQAARRPPDDRCVTFSAEVRSARGIHFRLTATIERSSERAAVEADTVAFRVAGDDVVDLRLERSGEVADAQRSLRLTPESAARLLAEVRAFCEATLPANDLGPS